MEPEIMKKLDTILEETAMIKMELDNYKNIISIILENDNETESKNIKRLIDFLIEILEMDNSNDIRTFRDFLTQYNEVTESCFNSCVTNFSTRTVSDTENKCAHNCLEKYLKMTQRLSTRFQEHMQAAEASK